ncbi:hypothetical protein BGZ65_010466, partial [Modicella reniformis]
MVFGGIVSSPRGILSPQQFLELANVYLENANKTKDLNITLVLCHDTETSLSQARKGAKRDEHQAVREGVTTAYIGLGRVLENRGHLIEAQASYKKAEKMVKVQDQGMHSVKNILDSNADTLAVKLPSVTSITHHNQSIGNALIPSLIFEENVALTTTITKLPEPDERLISTLQLVCCLCLLKPSLSLDDTIEPCAREWLKVVQKDEDERERLKTLATDVIRTFKRDELKDAKAIAEVVTLSPALEKDAFRDLLVQFYDGISQSDLLDFHQFDGLAHLIQGADPGFLDAGDLVKILGLLTIRLQDTHQQSPQHIYQLTLTASRVLDAMADTKVEGLDREKLHEPLSSYLNAMKD